MSAAPVGPAVREAWAKPEASAAAADPEASAAAASAQREAAAATGGGVGSAASGVPDAASGRATVPPRSGTCPASRTRSPSADAECASAAPSSAASAGNVPDSDPTAPRAAPNPRRDSRVHRPTTPRHRHDAREHRCSTNRHHRPAPKEASPFVSLPPRAAREPDSPACGECLKRSRSPPHSGFGPAELVLGIEHTPSRPLETRNPLLPRPLLIHPHRATTQTVERIIQRIPRQVLIVDRQTTASRREIGLRVHQRPRRHVPLRGQTRRLGTCRALSRTIFRGRNSFAVATDQ